MTDHRIDYEYTGSNKGQKIIVIAMYALGGICVLAGVIGAAMMRSWMILLLGAFCGLILAVLGLAIGASEWFWNDEKFTVISLGKQPQTYSWSDIRGASVNEQGVYVHISDGSDCFVSKMTDNYDGFLNELRAHLK